MFLRAMEGNGPAIQIAAMQVLIQPGLDLHWPVERSALLGC